jgi:ABC-type sugar transport system ATPase subunit
MDGEYILEARGIEKSFPGVKALNGVDFKLKPGEVHALVGENGAGKSTLMLVLGGVYQPEAGELYLEGERVSFFSPHDANRRGISVVYQELSLVLNLSVAENIFANRQPVKGLNMIKWRELHRHTRELLDFFSMDHIEPTTLVRELSIADQQVIEILKAISFEPKVLILDEPTSSLTGNEVTNLFRNIRLMTDRGIACVYISHHLPEVFEIADRVTVLRDGEYVCDEAVKDVDEDFLVTKMVGRALGNIYGKRNPADPIGEVLFEAKGISREGVFQAISFQVRSGEIVTLAGLVGAGRTEVGRAIFGAEPIEAGSINLDGQPVRIRSPQAAIELGIGYVTEDRRDLGLYRRFSLRQNLIANHLGDFTNKNGFLDNGRVREFSEEKVRDFRIVTPTIEQSVGNLSGGNQQKVLLSAWFGIEPRLLIVDEPTRGVDVGAKSEIYQFLRGFARQGVGILVISSDLNEVLGISDRILVMRSGTIAGEVPGSEATEENVIALAAGVESTGTEKGQRR